MAGKRTPPRAPTSAGPSVWLRFARVAAWPGLILALLIFGPSLTGRAAQPLDQPLKPSGYDQVVNDLLVPLRWIEVAYSADGEARIGLAQSVGSEQRLARFVNNSYLRRDFADASLWRLDDTGDAVQGIDPFAHFVPRPFAPAEAWTGEIRFAGGPVEVFTLDTVEGTGSLRLTSAALDTPPICAIDMTRGRITADRPLGSARVCVTDRNNVEHEAARLILAGNRLLLRVQNNLVKASLGQAAPISPGEGGIALVPVEVGEVVTFTFEDRDLTLLVDRGAETVSRVTKDGERLDYPGLGSLSAGLVTAMTARHDPRNAIRLSLDSELQGAAQRALEEGARRLQGPNGDAFPASVTLMDGLTGEVLALASYPASPDDLGVSQRRTRQGRLLLGQNQNLRRHVVGSTAKTPLAMAIIDADPTLASLMIAPGTNEPVRTVLGIDLGGPFSNHGASVPLLNFTQFLQMSSNRYALALMLLGAGEDPARSYPDDRRAGETWRLNGQTRTDVPRLPLFEANRRGPDGMTPILPATFVFPWGARLEALFDVASQQPQCLVDVGIWRGFGVNPQDCRSSFAGVSPEREFLGLNAVSDLRSQYLMSMLGGARSLWTSVKLAEVYSRIVSGRTVRARMTPVQDDVSHQPGPGPLPARASSREAVLLGLEAVLKQGGTAVSLGRAFERMKAGGAYATGTRLFGKTGTANVDAPARPTAASFALDGLARDCGLRWDGERGRLYVGDVSSSDDIARAEALGRLPQARCRAFAEAGGAAAMVREMKRHDCPAGRTRCRPEGINVGSDGFVRAFPLRYEPTHPGSEVSTGHAFVGSVVRYGPDGETPVRVLTVVVNLLKRTDDNRSPALKVAETILDDSAVQDWVSLSAEPGESDHP